MEGSALVRTRSCWIKIIASGISEMIGIIEMKEWKNRHLGLSIDLGKRIILHTVCHHVRMMLGTRSEAVFFPQHPAELLSRKMTEIVLFPLSLRKNVGMRWTT